MALKKTSLLLISSTLSLLLLSNTTQAFELTCTKGKWNAATLKQLKTDKFILGSDAERNSLALSLAKCLSNIDPVIRDDISFTALSEWLRGNKLNITTKLSLFNSLLAVVNSPVDDNDGVYKSFATLTLSELARADRKQPYLSNEQRKNLVNITTSHFKAIKDYRGFDEAIGWRHAIAHSADLFMQLSLNPEIEKPELDLMLNALAKQVNAKNNHFYIYGEPRRLARATLYIYHRGLHSNEEWQNWFTSVTAPAPFTQWQEVYTSQVGLAKLHNTRAFISELFALSQSSKNNSIIKIKESSGDALKAIN